MQMRRKTLTEIKKNQLRNVPDIDMSTLQVLPDTKREPAAPTVNALFDRLENRAGSKLVLPVCGRDVTFTLKVIPSEKVKRSTMVWTGNERLQDLLTEKALDDLIPSFKSNGQQNPAFGRSINGVIEVADGSRRRMASILTDNDYRVLVGELDEQQMAALSSIGNEYRPTSAYERGRRYERRLNTEFNGKLAQLAEAEGLARKTVLRCLNTAKLPLEIISLFSHPGELSARTGEALAKTYQNNKVAMFAFTDSLIARQKKGEVFETDELITLLSGVTPKPDREPTKERNFGDSYRMKYKPNGAVAVELKNAPEELLKKIEDLLESYIPDTSLADE
jgi:ParB family chromosome partitioning protein